MSDPKISLSRLQAPAIGRRQQKWVGYRVTALWKATEENYVAAVPPQNGTPAC